ncbi:Uma2 family endonuclease [Actinokineospora cianjurensis]|uniref:Uma2 family endonuclease n=1 Tax=Actinokineospora cianjurensis TaxID=585224 RepID=A0A421AWB2_9PSEU|nr:Uma2 family endonuclease [Actinokineospora cianjurensis]RLK54233.1 Uma2 family endonuclease [Actinokineospora cianjurensis]
MIATRRHDIVLSAPRQLLTIAEYAALGPTGRGYTELLEGRLLMSPSPSLSHMSASGELFRIIKPQLPAHLRVVQCLDIDLGYGPPDGPGYSRRADLIVFHESAAERLAAEGGLIQADEVEVVIEIISPGRHRTTRLAKFTEYAEAGIPHYWMVDTSGAPSVQSCHLTETFRYQRNDETRGVFKTEVPFPVTIDLAELE